MTLLTFKNFENKKEEDMKVVENLIFPNYLERIEDLKVMIDRYDGENMSNFEYIHLLDRYLYNLKKLKITGDDIKIKGFFKYIYEKSDLMKAESFEEQESINRVIRRLNKLCDKFKCDKIKDANGEIIK